MVNASQRAVLDSRGIEYEVFIADLEKLIVEERDYLATHEVILSHSLSLSLIPHSLYLILLLSSPVLVHAAERETGKEEEKKDKHLFQNGDNIRMLRLQLSSQCHSFI